MARYDQHLSRVSTPQSEPIPGSTQVQNEAGGYGWQVDCWERARRFLILGAEDGTYYADQKTLVRESAAAVEECAKEDAIRLVAMVREFRTGNRAPRTDPLIYALALTATVADEEGRKHALGEAFQEVIKTQSQLTKFLVYLSSMRGRGRAVRGAVLKWLYSKSASDLAYQWSKYRTRDGWSVRDVLRTFHPKPLGSGVEQPLYQWAVKGIPCDIQPIAAMEALHKDPTAVHAILAIQQHGLVREHIPTELLNSPDVWEALLMRMPATALIRNLGKMTSVGLLKPMSGSEQIAVQRLTDFNGLVKARVNPLAILLAAETYAQGHGTKGKLHWNPSGPILSALSAAFRGTFASVPTTGKRWCIAIDSSGSMSWNGCTAYRRALALALVLVTQEPRCVVMSFDSEARILPLTGDQRLDDVLSNYPTMGGSTDCSLPFKAMEASHTEVDIFVILTDNQSWCGRPHPYQALQKYRRQRNPKAKFLTVNIEANAHTMTPREAQLDTGCVSVDGFDANLLTIAHDLAMR